MSPRERRRASKSRRHARRARHRARNRVEYNLIGLGADELWRLSGEVDVRPLVLSEMARATAEGWDRAYIEHMSEAP